MKKLLLSGIAALFLATGAAHAGRCGIHQCGRTMIEICALGGRPGYEDSYAYDFDLGKLTKGDISFRFDRGITAVFLNGKRCQFKDPLSKP